MYHVLIRTNNYIYTQLDLQLVTMTFNAFMADLEMSNVHTYIYYALYTIYWYEQTTIYIHSWVCNWWRWRLTSSWLIWEWACCVHTYIVENYILCTAAQLQLCTFAGAGFAGGDNEFNDLMTDLELRFAAYIHVPYTIFYTVHWCILTRVYIHRCPVRS